MTPPPPRPSSRIPDPGPRPVLAGRTPEQTAALVVGSAFLVLGVVAAIAVVRRLDASAASLLIVPLPVLYLAIGWLSLLYGMARLSDARRTSSLARGPWLAIGLLVFLVSAPMGASFAYPVREVRVTFTCDCGTRAEASGSQNYWGDWLSQRLTVLSVTPKPGQNPMTCPHAGHVPWVKK